MNAKKCPFALVVILLVITQIMAGCGGSTPIFYDSGVPESRIVVVTDAKDNCAAAQTVSSTFSTVDTRTQETAWSVEGKAGIGGKIPLGAWIPALDIEAAITDHYGSKETRTWQNSYTDAFDVPGNSKSVLAVFYQEMTRTGTIDFYGKHIEYQYPSEVTRLGWRKVDLACNLPPPMFILCADPSNGTAQYNFAPQYESLAGTWRLAQPADGEIVQVEIQVDGAQVSIYVQTDGSSGVADWGYQPQCTWSDLMQVVYQHLLFKTTTITFVRSNGSELYATVEDRYIDPPVYIPVQTTDYLFTR